MYTSLIYIWDNLQKMKSFPENKFEYIYILLAHFSYLCSPSSQCLHIYLFHCNIINFQCNFVVIIIDYYREKKFVLLKYVLSFFFLMFFCCKRFKKQFWIIANERYGGYSKFLRKFSRYFLVKLDSLFTIICEMIKIMK